MCITAIAIVCSIGKSSFSANKG